MLKSWAVNVALGTCLALGLSACAGGGGGGSNVKPAPPPPVDTSPLVVSADLAVATGQAVTRPIVLESGADLDNQGAVGGNVDVGVEAKAASTITNRAGGTIRASKTAIRLDHGGEIRNDAGATIEATGTAGGDCGPSVRCAIFVGPAATAAGVQAASVQPDLILRNAGTINGTVQLDQAGNNHVTLVAGGAIHGDLRIGSGEGSVLALDGGTGTRQRFSEAVTGSTVFSQTLLKSGDGTWIIDANWGQPDLVQIDAGSLRIADGGPTDFTRPRTDGWPLEFWLRHGELVIDRSDDLVFQGYVYTDVASGEDGRLVKAGAGTLTWREDNWLPPALRIEQGTFRYGDTGSQARLSWGLSVASDVDNGGSLVIDTNKTLTWSGAISGSGSVAMNGSGILFLADENTYTGGTIANRGLVRTYGTLPGNTLVNAEGMVHAPVYAGDLSNAGVVDATGREGYGHGLIQRIAVGGDYSQSASGTLMVALGSRVDVAGTATLEGGTLEVFGHQEGYIADNHTTILTAAGGLTGTFDRVVEGSQAPVFVVTGIGYDATSVWLETQHLDITVAAQGDGIGYTPASMSAARRVQEAFEQLDAKAAADSMADVPGEFLRSAGRFQQAPTIEAAQASLRSLSGQLHAASAAMTFRAIDAGNEALSDRLAGLRDRDAAIGMWTQQLGGSGSMARSGFDGVGYRFNGWLVGNDYRVGHSAVAGFAFGQGTGIQQLQHGIDRDDSRRTEGMVYAGLSGDRWYAQGRVGFGHVRQYIDRQLLLGDVADGVWTRYDGRYEVAHGEGGLRLGIAGLRIAPFMSVEFARSDRGAFAEAGSGGFGLRSGAQALERWQATMGLRATRHWNFGHGRSLDFGAHAQWRRALGANGNAMEASFVGLEQWSPLAGIGLSRGGSLVGLGLDARLSPPTALKLSYDHERGQYDSARGLSIGVNMAF